MQGLPKGIAADLYIDNAFQMHLVWTMLVPNFLYYFMDRIEEDL